MGQLTVLANTQATRLRLLIDHVLPSGTLKVSSEDLIPLTGGSLTGLYEHLLAGRPQIQLAHPQGDPFGAETNFSYAIANHDGRFNVWFGQEVRGSVVRAHLYDMTDGEQELALVVGVLDDAVFEPGRVVITVAAFPPGLLERPYLTTVLDVNDWHEAPADRDIGRPFPAGFGVADRIPFRAVRIPTEDNPTRFYEYAIKGTATVWNVRDGADEDEAQVLPYVEGEDFLTQHRLVEGVPYTVLHFLYDNPIPPVRATVQRLGVDFDANDLAFLPWTSLGDTVAARRVVPGTHATLGTSDADSGNLVAGTTGVGLGALTFPLDATAPYWTLLESADLAVQSFRVSFPFTRGSGGAGPILLGPLGTTDSGAASAETWAAVLNADGKIEIHADYGSGPALRGTTSAALPVGTEVLITINRDGAGGDWQVWFDRTQVLDQASAGTIAYGGEDDVQLGAWKAGGTVAYLKGHTIGEVRWRGAFVAQSDVDEAFYRLQRNPAFYLSEILVNRLSATVDATARLTAAAALHAASGGPIRCDGWIADQDAASGQATTVRAVVDAVCILRSIRLPRLSSGAFAITVPVAATEAVCTLGIKDALGFRNARLVRRYRRRLGEATTRLRVQYRPQRDTGGGLNGYAGKYDLPALTVGGDGAQPVQLTHVYDHRTGRQVADWLRKLVRREQRIELVANSEGRMVRPGDVVRLKLSAAELAGHYDPGTYAGLNAGIGHYAPAVETDEWEAEQVTLSGAAEYGIKLLPYDPAQFAFDAGTLNTDPVVEPAGLDLGNAAGIEIVSVVVTDPRRPSSGGSFELRFAIRNRETLLPVIANPSTIGGTTVNGGTVTGAAGIAEALAAEGDDSYVRVSTNVQAQVVTFTPPSASARGRISAIKFIARARVGVAGGLTAAAGYFKKIAATSGWTFADLGTGTFQAGQNVAAGFADLAAFAPTAGPRSSGSTTIPWALSDLRSGNIAEPMPGDLRLAVVPTLTGGGAVDVSRLYIVLDTEQDPPRGFGGVKWLAIRSDTEPDQPIYGIDPFVLGLGLNFTMANIALGTWWVWAAVVDRYGRLVEMFGPLQVNVLG